MGLIKNTGGGGRIGKRPKLKLPSCKCSDLKVTKYMYTVFHKLHLGVQVFLTEVLNMLKLTPLFYFRR